jgi:hypothetical protein
MLGISVCVVVAFQGAVVNVGCRCCIYAFTGSTFYISHHSFVPSTDALDKNSLAPQWGKILLRKSSLHWFFCFLDPSNARTVTPCARNDAMMRAYGYLP